MQTASTWPSCCASLMGWVRAITSPTRASVSRVSVICHQGGHL